MNSSRARDKSSASKRPSAFASTSTACFYVFGDRVLIRPVVLSIMLLALMQFQFPSRTVKTNRFMYHSWHLSHSLAPHPPHTPQHRCCKCCRKANAPFQMSCNCQGQLARSHWCAHRPRRAKSHCWTEAGASHVAYLRGRH